MNQNLMQQVMQLLGNNNPNTKPMSPMKSLQQQVGSDPRMWNSADGRVNNLNRAMKDPKKAFNALQKFAGKMSPDKQKELLGGLNKIMGNRFDGSYGGGGMIGQDIGGLGGANQAANIFSNFTSPEDLGSTPSWDDRKKQMAAIDSGEMDHKDGYSHKAINSQRRKGGAIQNLLNNMGMSGPGSGYGGFPGGPQPGNSLPWQTVPGAPPAGPMPGGPGVMGQPSMPGGIQPPVRVNNPGTFFGGQQPQQPPNQFQQQLQSQIGNITQGMPQAPMLNPGTMQGPMGMSPTMGQPPAGSLPAFNNPQYGGTGIR